MAPTGQAVAARVQGSIATVRRYLQASEWQAAEPLNATGIAVIVRVGSTPPERARDLKDQTGYRWRRYDAMSATWNAPQTLLDDPTSQH